MKAKIKYLLLFLVLIALGISAWWFKQPKQKSTLPPPAELPTAMFRSVKFNELPGWDDADLKKSLRTFQMSCRAFIRQDPEQVVGTDYIDLRVKDWQPACKSALTIKPMTEEIAKDFFQKWFLPVEFFDKKSGLFTGYYLPSVKGSLTRTEEFKVPLYEIPDDMVIADLGLFSSELKNKRIIGRLDKRKLVPYHTREEISHGVLKGKARVLAWINNPIDRLFLEIQGSGVIELGHGKSMAIGYGAQNGRPYTAIAGVLIRKGVMTRENASMQLIKNYLIEHPEEIHEVINQNQSFVFFRRLDQEGALGTQGVSLTPGYSLAIDTQWIPLGTPLWLNTSRPDSRNPDENTPMQRLMIAQDTGGAIRGKIRGDVFWGGGERATFIAGHMKNNGQYWLLLPRHTIARLKVNQRP